MKRIPLAGSRRVALVSDCDYLYLRRFNWCLHSTKQKTPYAQARVDGRNQLMHRVIAVRVKRLFSRKIDHRDRNGLNCQRCNLRRATSSQNGGNQTKHRNNTSGYKGVTWFPKCNKWRAQIKFHGKVVHLGLFTVKRKQHKPTILPRGTASKIGLVLTTSPIHWMAGSRDKSGEKH